MHTHFHTTRRDFFRAALGSALAGAAALELGFHRAAWARGMASAATDQVFDIEKVADGVYAAIARAQRMLNCNAAIFVNSKDVLVVDAHSKPSAAASLIAQIKKEITDKPVRCVVNSHFHWDHVQGNSAYKTGGGKVDFVASEPTKQLMAQEVEKRLRAALELVPKQIATIQSRASAAKSAEEKAFCAELIRQLQAYQTEMKNFSLELPTVTFAKSHVIRDRAHDLHVEFHGHAHTVGDVVVFCPQKRVIATGDVIHGFLPNIADGYPKAWPKTMDAIGQRPFEHIVPGHGAVYHDRKRMRDMRNYIEELTARVEEGKMAGKTVTELQKTITVASLQSLQSNGYGDFAAANLFQYVTYFKDAKPLQDGLMMNIAEVYRNLDRV